MELTQKAERWVFDLFKDKLSAEYTYHNFNHTLRVVNSTKKLIENEIVTQNEKTALLLAAWFHDTGYINGTEDHEAQSVILLRTFLKGEMCDPAIAELTESLILATSFSYEPKTIAESIIKDADTNHFSDTNYRSLSELLREEWEKTLEKKFSDLDWALENRKLLTRVHRYHTHYAQTEWQPLKDANIAMIQQDLKMLEKKRKKQLSKKGKIPKEDRPDRGIETMFRTTLKNHTQLSQIADSKANILLSVNAIIISIALSSLIPKLDSPANQYLVMPTFIMVFFSVISVVFAILSTKPKVTPGLFTREQIGAKNTNLLFFGNFFKMPVEEYVWAMNEMMKDKQYLYDSMIKDLYYLGLVLNRKYTLLRITYTIFMIGIIISVGAFVVAFKLSRI